MRNGLTGEESEMGIGVLGGSFDPVHRGHVAMARHALASSFVREVLVVPARLSPYKERSGASPDERLAMARLAFHDLAQCRVDDLELQRPHPSYMVDTLDQLRARHPGRKFYLIIGADNVAGFSGWRQAPRILEMAEVLVLGRHGHPAGGAALPSDRFHWLAGFDERVSSREIRAMLAEGVLPGSLLDPAVSRFIVENALYR